MDPRKLGKKLDPRATKLLFLRLAALLKPTKSLELKMPLRCLVIGDPHFQKDAFLQGRELIKKTVKLASKLRPDIIVILGDVMDTHETARNSPWLQSLEFIESLSKISKTYVLMGNHDLINQSQFLTSNHFFTPLKKWEGVHIVDYPLHQSISGVDLIFCPYVPTGRFKEALGYTVSGDGDKFYWENARCIFAHQEFAGAEYGGRVSTKGDSWEEDLPLVVSGHIHTEMNIGDNLKYTGSSRQVASDESPDKRIWMMTFSSNPGDPISIKKYNLCLKSKKEITIDYQSIKKFDLELAEKYYVKLKVKGTREQFKMLKKNPYYLKLSELGVKTAFDFIEETEFVSVSKGIDVKQLSFVSILEKLVESKPDNVKQAFQEVFSEN